LFDERYGLVGSGVFNASGFGFDYKFHAIHTWALVLVMDSNGIGSGCCHSRLLQDFRAFIRHIIRLLQLMARHASRRSVICATAEALNALAIALLLRFVDSLMINTEAFAINAGGPFNATTFLSLG